jgi:hypothetical protein
MFRKEDKPPKNWNAHVTGEVKFKSHNRITMGEALYAEISFIAKMTKGDEAFTLNLTASGAIEECEYSWDKDKFYARAVSILQNRRGELDMALKDLIENRLKYYFKNEAEKSAKAILEELIKTPIHIKMDIKLKDEDVFQA